MALHIDVSHLVISKRKAHGQRIKRMWSGMFSDMIDHALYVRFMLVAVVLCMLAFAGAFLFLFFGSWLQLLIFLGAEFALLGYGEKLWRQHKALKGRS